MSISENATMLEIVGRIDPTVFDVINQISFNLSEGTRLIMSSMVIKSVAMEMNNVKIRSQLTEVGKSLFATGVKSMSYEDDFWYCGTPYTHSPIPLRKLRFNNPANEELEGRFKEYLTEVAHLSRPDHFIAVLQSLANVIKQEELANNLRTVAKTINEKNER